MFGRSTTREAEVIRIKNELAELEVTTAVQEGEIVYDEDGEVVEKND